MGEELRITLLGSPVVTLNGEPVTGFVSSKAQALVYYLAATGRQHTREAMAGLLWSDVPDATARKNLRDVLPNLRRLIGPYLHITRQTVSINPQAPCVVDSAAFSAALSRFRSAESLSAPPGAEDLVSLSAVVDLCQGKFLAGFYVADAPLFEEWVLGERERLQRELEEALESLVRGHGDRGEFQPAITFAQRWSSLDPLREAAHRALIELFALSGDRAAALRQYQACADVLQAELGVGPASETTELYERVRAGELRVGVPERALRVIRGYEIRERIGEGGFGAVYRAYQPQVGREVAIKVILPQFANHPEFIRRFEAEAHLVARLEHPHIVPLYDYWREPDGAYLVMRWLRGGSLKDALQRGPWKAEAAVRLMDQIAAALATAHRQGVVHRDIKPANILLDEAANAYLTDFGVAKDLGGPTDLTHPDALTGSPEYISPEQIQDGPVTPLTDVYSLGVVLYELLTAAHPFPDESLAALLVKHLNEPLPSALALRPELPPAVDEVIQQATAKDPAQRFPDALSLADALGSAWRPTAELPEVLPLDGVRLAEPTNPYKGLRPFLEADAVDFFGREALTESLLARLADAEEAARFLAVVGPSGSGKSSVVRAGLVPALRRGALPGSENWFVVQMLPGAHPLEELEAALLRVAVNPPETLLNQMREDERGLIRAVKRCLPEDSGELLLVVDQFEELFTLVEDESERAHFLNSLQAAVTDPRGPLRLVVTLRADFYDRPLGYAGFGELTRQRTEVVLPLSSTELERAIAGPAERVGVSLEPGLMAGIVADVTEQPGALPLLQYALTELFEHREYRTLTLEAYHSIGGVLGALGRRAEELYQGLDHDGQEATRQLFLRLIMLGEGIEDTRRRVLRVELAGLTMDDADAGIRRKIDAVSNAAPSSSVVRPSSSMDEVIDLYGRYRLLTFDRDPVTRGPTVEVAHEALLREWGRLREWLETSRADVRMQRLLADAASEWKDAECDASYLLRGARLAQFEGWAADSSIALTQDERSYLAASSAARQARQAERERRRRRTILALAGGLVIALILALMTGQQWQRAEDEVDARATAEADALRQASVGMAAQALAELEGKFPERTVPLALEALEAYPYTWQAERALGQAVLENRLQLILAGHSGWINHVAWSPDGTQIATASDDRTVIVWDGRTGEKQFTLTLHRDDYLPDSSDFGVVHLAWSPDGTHIATAGYLATKVWDAGSGEELLPLSGSDSILQGRLLKGTVMSSSRVAWSPAGDRILTDHSSTARVWDAATGEQLLKLQHTAPVLAVAWSPAGDHIVSGDQLGIVKIWDARTGHELLTLDRHRDAVNQVVWSPSGDLILTASDDHTASVWDASPSSPTYGKELHTFTGHRERVGNALWSPSGDRVATASRDATIRVWDPATGEVIFTFNEGDLLPEAHTSAAVGWAPSGDRIAVSRSEGGITVYDAASGDAILTLSGQGGQILSAAWSPDGEHLVTAGQEPTAKVWDVSPRARVLVGHADAVNAVDWSPSGDRLATVSRDGTARIWDAVTGEELLVRDIAIEMWRVSWSPSGDRIGTATKDDPGLGFGIFQVWDALPSSPWFGREIVGITGRADDISWSPKGDRFVAAHRSGYAIIWDATTGELLYLFGGHHPEPVTSADWSPDGERIVTSGEGGYALVWDADTGEELLRLQAEPAESSMERAAWSPDGKRIATHSDDRVGGRIWDATTGELLFTFTGHAGTVTSIVWSATGDRLLTASLDGTAKIWDAQSGAELLSFSFNWPLGGAKWSPDMAHIAFGLGDGTVRIVDVHWHTREELIAYARECCLIRELTDDERELFGLPQR